MLTLPGDFHFHLDLEPTKASIAGAALGTSRTPAAACHTARDTTECLDKHVRHLLGKWFDGMRTVCHAKQSNAGCI